MAATGSSRKVLISVKSALAEKLPFNLWIDECFVLTTEKTPETNQAELLNEIMRGWIIIVVVIILLLFCHKTNNNDTVLAM